jgi:hypothetical protein
VIGKKKKEDVLSVIILNKIFHKEMGKYSLSLCGKEFDSEYVVDDDLEGKNLNVLVIFGGLPLDSLFIKDKILIVFRIAIISIAILNTNIV